MLSPPGLALEVIKGEHDNAFAERADDRYLSRYRWFLQMLDGEEKKAAQPDPNMPAPGGPPPGAPGPGPGAPPPGMMPGGMGPPGPMGPAGPPGIPDLMGGGAAQMAAGMNPMMLAQGVS
jgi:hypothetical protein